VFLITEAVIVNKLEKDKDPAGMPDGDGMM
jgi:hypothetical protein